MEHGSERGESRVVEPEDLKTVPVSAFFLITVPVPGHKKD
jgi:hypothetical protein